MCHSTPAGEDEGLGEGYATYSNLIVTLVFGHVVQALKPPKAYAYA